MIFEACNKCDDEVGDVSVEDGEGNDDAGDARYGNNNNKDERDDDN